MPKIRKVSLERRLRKLAASKKRKALLLRRKLEKTPEFRDIVRNVLKISERTGYDPASGTNWCHLPMEIRMMCMKSMNFRTRACLRGTSTTEKALVESEKYYVGFFFMDSEVFRMDNYTERIEDDVIERNESWKRERSRKMAVQIRLILKLCLFNSIYVRFNDILEPEDFVEDFPIYCNELEFKDVENELVLFFMRNCVPGMRTIQFEWASCLPMYQIVHSRSVYTARSVNFTFLECACYLHELIEIWRLIDAEVGTNFSTDTRDKVFRPLVARFGYRDIDENVNSIQFPIGFPSGKQLLVTRSSWNNWETVKCTVVHAEPEIGAEASE